MIKFILDAMYYQIFIFNRDKFILENPHERTIQIICGILFLPVIVLTYLLIEENFKKVKISNSKKMQVPPMDSIRIKGEKS